MDRWFGKIALVTGASVGIGNAITKKLAENGMKVVACARNEKQLNRLADDVNEMGTGLVHPYRCDVKDESQVLKMFEFIRSKFGTMHVCVNNAALAHHAPLLSGSTEEWREMIDVNMVAVAIGCRESVKLMRESGVDDGHVINIVGMSGYRVIHLSMYSATKFAVSAITQCLRNELIEAKTHIRCTAISPGRTESEFSPRLNRTPLNNGKGWYEDLKWLQTEDAAEAVLFALKAPAHVDVSEIRMITNTQNK